jgi:putative ubiquitin-RnfH superfamily antitoxin RatB of RatAB toxin-antitoxin module
MTPVTLSVIVTVAYAASEIEALVVVTLPAGATVNDAIAKSGIVARLGLDPTLLEFAIFGRRVPGHTRVENDDRVELTRPLVADPKGARRKRAADHAKPLSSPRTKPRG